MPLNLSQLTRTPAPELLALYSELAAPQLDELQGEYSATLLPQLHPLIESLGRWAINHPLYPGYWLAKAFEPVDGESGRGYNLFRFRNRMARRWPMQTRIVPSRFDGRPTFELYYPAYNSICSRINMVDELRKLDEGLYLGFGTLGFGQKMRSLRLPFALQGPIGQFRGMPDGDALKNQP